MMGFDDSECISAPKSVSTYEPFSTSYRLQMCRAENLVRLGNRSALFLKMFNINKPSKSGILSVITPVIGYMAELLNAWAVYQANFSCTPFPITKDALSTWTYGFINPTTGVCIPAKPSSFASRVCALPLCRNDLIGGFSFRYIIRIDSSSHLD